MTKLTTAFSLTLLATLLAPPTMEEPSPLLESTPPAASTEIDQPLSVTGPVEELVVTANGSVLFRVHSKKAVRPGEDEAAHGQHDVWFRAGAERSRNTHVEVQVLMALLDRPEGHAVTVTGERNSLQHGIDETKPIFFETLRILRRATNGASTRASGATER